MVLVDKLGRRILLITSTSIMAIALSGLGAFFFLQSHHDEESMALLNNLTWLPLTSLLLYVVGFSAGEGTIPFMLMGEMFPHSMKNTLGGISSAFLLANTFLTVKLFPLIKNTLGLHWVFWINALIQAAGAIFTYFALPETKGKSLEEIEDYFKKRLKIKERNSNP